jgi:hypothetical protein
MDLFYTLLFILVGLPVAMFIAYLIGIQYQNEKLWMIVRGACLFEVVLIALPLDALLNWTLFSFYLLQFPKVYPAVPKTEWTFSDRVNRQCQEDSLRGKVCLLIGKVLNYTCPTHDHIPNAIGR